MQKKTTDSFGNSLDPIVGFARGTIIQSSVDEARRLRQGQKIAAERVRRLGAESIGVFTGNQREFPLKVEDLNTHCEEWVGPGLFAEELRLAAIAHMGGEPTDGVAAVNRTSAGIIAAIAALADGKSVVSVVPPSGRSHASVSLVHESRCASSPPTVQSSGPAAWRQLSMRWTLRSPRWLDTSARPRT